MLFLPAFVYSLLLPQAYALVLRSPPPEQQTALPPSQDPFYTAPDGYAHANPGDILRMRVAPGNLTAVTTNASEAYNILYRTTDSRYSASWAVTTVFVPSRNGSTGQQLLSYQVAYDSADIDSSPSYTLRTVYEPDIMAALGRGWYVSCPDYEGPLASYTSGVQAGHATIDSVRAARAALAGLGLSVRARYAMWGYSGGALATEWAAELQVQYAPELDFAGMAIGGITPNVTNVLLTVDGTSAANLVPAGMIGLTSQFPKARAVLEASLKTTGPYNATVFNSVSRMNLNQSTATFANQTVTDYFTNGTALLSSPAYKSIANNVAQMGYHGVPNMPVYAYKAIHDEISPIADTDALVAYYCGVGANIHYQRNTVGGHVAGTINWKPASWAFLDSVLGGTYNHTEGCRVENVTVAISTMPS